MRQPDGRNRGKDEKEIQPTKVDKLAKSQKMFFSVIPAEAGIQDYQGFLDPGFRRGDGLEGF